MSLANPPTHTPKIERKQPVSAKATLIAAAWMIGEPLKGFWTSDLTRYINDGGGGQFMEPSVTYYPSEIRRKCYALREAGYMHEISWGRFQISGKGWERALQLTGGRGLL